VQTFLPYPDFYESASVLERSRLGKQRVEVLQLMNSLHPESTSRGWHNHPARNMWRGWEDALALYGVIICEEWISRGYKDTCREKILLSRQAFSSAWQGRELEEMRRLLEERYRGARKGEEPDFLPSWIGSDSFHASHRSNLLRKDSEWYGQFGWTEPEDLPYVWPLREEGGAPWQNVR